MIRAVSRSGETSSGTNHFLLVSFSSPPPPLTKRSRSEAISGRSCTGDRDCFSPRNPRSGGRARNHPTAYTADADNRLRGRLSVHHQPGDVTPRCSPAELLPALSFSALRNILVAAVSI